VQLFAGRSTLCLPMTTLGKLHTMKDLLARRRRGVQSVLVATVPTALAACTGDGRAANADAGKGGVSLADAGGESAATDGPAAADALHDDAPVVACASAQDCRSASQASLSIFCCTDNACILDTPGSCTDANVQLIQASSYDESCTTDRDCMWVLQGNACHPLDCRDPGAINVRSYAQYLSDLAKTRGGSCVAPQGDCPTFGTCCRSGSCRMCNGGDASAE
jgi:hypothetical protein